MKYSFSSQFLKSKATDSNFGEAWESFCYDLLVAEFSDNAITRLEPPDRGVDILHRSREAALNDVTVAEIVNTLQICLDGVSADTAHVPSERNPLLIELRLPRAIRSSVADLSQVRVKGHGGNLVPLAELGRWEDSRLDKTISIKVESRMVGRA